MDHVYGVFGSISTVTEQSPFSQMLEEDRKLRRMSRTPQVGACAMAWRGGGVGWGSVETARDEAVALPSLPDSSTVLRKVTCPGPPEHSPMLLTLTAYASTGSPCVSHVIRNSCGVHAVSQDVSTCVMCGPWTTGAAGACCVPANSEQTMRMMSASADAGDACMRGGEDRPRTIAALPFNVDTRFPAIQELATRCLPACMGSREGGLSLVVAARRKKKMKTEQRTRAHEHMHLRHIAFPPIPRVSVPSPPPAPSPIQQ